RSAAPADPVRHRPGDLPPIPAVSAVPAIPTVPGVTTVRSTTTGSAPLHVPTTTCATLAALAGPKVTGLADLRIVDVARTVRDSQRHVRLQRTLRATGSRRRWRRTLSPHNNSGQETVRGRTYTLRRDRPERAVRIRVWPLPRSDPTRLCR